ncbi:hypothetical protein Prudu_006748 [Prunus dulcis]|uniref:UDP-Glycosyltransferase superfamily protein n=1 Tax=Prunus dulcis TaxID=3755 RepID=A0A4Y1R0G1_PRUDU|nr:hypothetical protein Prudu_006748 [Prunus dulcis]
MKRESQESLLPPEQPSAKREISSDGSPNNVIFDWLDKQKPKSVVFIGFGSECKLSKEQVFEIAHGLELSELPFLWALRKPNWANSEADALPPSFVERTTEKGLVCLGWVPQMEILGAPISWGPLNARLLVEKDLAVEVKRTEDGSVCKDYIAKTLRHAMVAEEGRREAKKQCKESCQSFWRSQAAPRPLHWPIFHYLKNNVTRRSF